ncbi:OprO/OprP family phosphate-selective porin [Kushneria sp. AK178]
MIASAFFRWSNRPRHHRCAAVLALVTMGAGLTPARADVFDTVQAHGFLSQALIISRHNDFFGPSSHGGGSLQYTEVGANVSMRPTSDLLVSAQVLSRRAGDDNSDYEPKLDYGLLDYQLFANNSRAFGIQIGRIKHPFGIYNQTRDIAFTRPGILLPQSIYFDRTRSFGLASDGVLFYNEERLKNGILYFSIEGGWPSLNGDAESALDISGDHPAVTMNEEFSTLAQIRYEHDGGRMVFAFSVADVNAEFDSGVKEAGEGKFKFQPIALSAQYNSADWSLTTEYALRRRKISGLDMPDLNQSVIGESWYLQYDRRLLEDWRWLVRYDVMANDWHDRSGRQYENDNRGPAHSRFARDLTLGLKWQPRTNFLLSAEYHNIDGTGWIPPADNERDDLDRYWDMLMFQASFLF